MITKQKIRYDAYLYDPNYEFYDADWCVRDTAMREKLKNATDLGCREHYYFKCKVCGDVMDKDLGERRYCSDHCKYQSHASMREAVKQKAREKARLENGSPEFCMELIRSAAERRNVPFLLTLEEYKTLFGLPCHYCGGDVVRSGLDRKDGRAGYELANVVPCCGQCNLAKFHARDTDFIAWAKRVAARHPD